MREIAFEAAVAGCGHFPWIERPGCVAGALNTAAICGFPATGFR
jgi:hypothetical protein